MLKNRKKRTGLFLGIVVIALLGATFLILKSYLFPYHLPTYNFDKQQATVDKFKKEIHYLGGERAYNRLYEAVGNLSADDQHEYGHLFGVALYKQEGLKGIRVCDTRFSYGCFHQILSSALISYGPSAVPMLNKKCKEILGQAYLSCQHGLGHGILVSIGLNKKGYSETHLIEALAECQKIPDDQPLGGCDGGVHMEYNLHTIANVELNKNDIRHPVQGDSDAPCDKLVPNQQSTCYFWIPQWWALAGGLRYTTTQALSDDQLYQSTGSMCEQLREESRRTCFEGVGYAAISTAKLNSQRTLSLCNLASSDSLNRLYCLSFAASMLKSVTRSSSTALSMCQDLSGKSKSYCIAYANEEGNFFRSLPNPVL